jgi:hypothetical protein
MMMRETLSILLASFFVLQPALYARAAGGQSANDGSRTAAIRQTVEAAGVGAQIEVTLRDKNALRGRLISASSDDFIVQTGEDRTAVVHKVRFEDVESVNVENPATASAAHKPRSKISKRGKIMLVVGFAALIFGVVTYATTKGP